MMTTNGMTEFQRAYAGSSLNEQVRTLVGPRESWLDRSRFTWTVEASPLHYTDKTGKQWSFDRKRVLYRSDTGAPLAVLGKNFKPVQPANVLEFFESVADDHNFQLEMVGEANGGRMLWGLARTPLEIHQDGENIAAYLMLLTANDGTVATRAWFTSIRLSCTNQLPWIVRGTAGRRSDVKGLVKNGGIARQTHGKTFNIKALRGRLAAVHEHWGKFEQQIGLLRQTSVNDDVAAEMFHRVTKPDAESVKLEDVKARSVVGMLMNTYHTGVGQENIHGTAWGVVNAVTRHLDHDAKVKDAGVRIARNWIGGGRIIKERTLDLALTYAETGELPQAA